MRTNVRVDHKFSSSPRPVPGQSVKLHTSDAEDKEVEKEEDTREETGF